MGTTYRFIEEPKSTSDVLEWFRALPQPPAEHLMTHGFVLYFREMGPLVYNAKGDVDANRCPVVNLFLPKTKRSVLWTVGEVHFLATPLRQLFPPSQYTLRNFPGGSRREIAILPETGVSNPYDYYLEVQSEILIVQYMHLILVWLRYVQAVVYC